jgi:hypothetical protein
MDPDQSFCIEDIFECHEDNGIEAPLLVLVHHRLFACWNLRSLDVPRRPETEPHNTM